MKVIYAGFPKTGTKTMNAALTELGYTCYDYLENGYYLNEEWKKVFREGGTVEDFRKMYENVDACMDTPCCFFWEEILEAFPDAKIIFSKRQTENEWWKSLENQLVINSDFKSQFLNLLSPTFWKIAIHDCDLSCAVYGVKLPKRMTRSYKPNELLFKKAYRMHNAYLLEKAPKDKLMVINFEDGWKPLCNFLNVPIPNTSFPHKNKKGSLFKEDFRTHPVVLKSKREALTLIALITLLSSFGFYRLISGKAKLRNLFTSLFENVFSIFRN